MTSTTATSSDPTLAPATAAARGPWKPSPSWPSSSISPELFWRPTSSALASSAHARVPALLIRRTATRLHRLCKICPTASLPKTGALEQTEEARCRGEPNAWCERRRGGGRGGNILKINSDAWCQFHSPHRALDITIFNSEIECIVIKPNLYR